MKTFKTVSLIVIIIGAINWGLIGLFDFNLVGFLFDNISVVLSRIIYSVVGIFGILSLILLFVPDDEFEYTHHRYKKELE
ncbi:MAG: DUF378 domain-containing protein [Bacilli bacterium]|nr:DUF378 domain-containing protein [Bacilli bacterium]